MRLIRSKKCIAFMIALLMFVLLFILLQYNGILGNSSEMPEVVFVRREYSDLKQGAFQETLKITFIDKYGACYCSSDPDVISESSYGGLLDAYENGMIEEKIKEDKIKLLKSYNKNKVRKKYRELCKIAEKVKKGDARMVTSVFKAFVVGTESKEWFLEGYSFNEYGDVVYVPLKEKGTVYEDVINNDPRVAQICEWYNDIIPLRNGSSKSDL